MCVIAQVIEQCREVYAQRGKAGGEEPALVPKPLARGGAAGKNAAKEVSSAFRVALLAAKRRPVLHLSPR